MVCVVSVLLALLLSMMILGVFLILVVFVAVVLLGGKGSGRRKGDGGLHLGGPGRPVGSFRSLRPRRDSIRRSLGRGYSLEGYSAKVKRPIVLVGFISVGRGSWGHMRHLMNNGPWDNVVLFSDEKGFTSFGEDRPVDWFLYKKWGIDKRAAFFASILDKYPGTLCFSLMSGGGADHMSLVAAAMILNRKFRLAFMRRGRAVHVDFSKSAERGYKLQFDGPIPGVPEQPVSRLPPGKNNALTFKESLDLFPRVM